MIPGSVHSTKNNGDFEIVKYLSSTNVLVKFLDTGFESKFRADKIRSGNIKDRLKPVLYSIGYVGNGKNKTSTNGRLTEAYQCWAAMLKRCYCKKYQKENKTYIGCSVDPKWHNFQNFADWYVKNAPLNLKGYHLDKDILIKGNKVYSDKACKFVLASENVETANSKEYLFRNPDGEVVKIFNLSKFCREKKLTRQRMSLVSQGLSISHKGWTKENPH